MELWKSRALEKSLPFIFSAFSMIITVGTEFFLILNFMIYDNASIAHANYPVYLAMFLEVFVQSYFYPPPQYQKQELHKTLVIVIIYLLLIIAGSYNDIKLWEWSGFKFINHVVCFYVAISILNSDINLIVKCFDFHQPKQLDIDRFYTADEFN